MSKLRCSITVSLDGFVAGPNQSADNPIGEGGVRLHDWVFPTKTFLALHGNSAGGETGINDDILREGFENVGATIMGRNMFGPVRGPWGSDPWQGWWGDNPPYHHPVFVLTHHAREPLVMEAEPRFISSPTASGPPSRRRARPPLAKTSHSAAAPVSSNNILPPACSMKLSFTSFHSCSAAASDSSITSMRTKSNSS